MPIQDHVTISEEYEHVTEVFGYRRMAFSVVFHNLEEVEDLESFMEEALTYIIDERFEVMALEDRLALEIHHPGLNSPINWPFLPRAGWNIEAIFKLGVINKVENIQQSASNEFVLDEEMTWIFTRVLVPGGGTRPSKKRPRNVFIDDEAAVSGGSEDEDDDDDNEHIDDESFINDDTESDSQDDGMMPVLIPEDLDDQQPSTSRDMPKLRHLKQRYPTINECLKQKHSLIDIDNNDNLCLARALVTAKAHLHRKETVKTAREYDTIRKGDRIRCTMQKRLAQALVRDAGLQNHQGLFTLQHLTLMMVTPSFRDYRVQVFSSDLPRFGRIYQAGESSNPTLHLLLHSQHFTPITSITGFHESAYYCDICDAPYNSVSKHVKCGHRCSCCQVKPACQQEAWMECQACGRWFRSASCLSNHLEKRPEKGRRGVSKANDVTGPSLCETYKRCTCGVSLRTNDKAKHECYKTMCSVCRQQVEQPHLCHVQQLPRTREPCTSFIFFDFEATQEKVVSRSEHGTTTKHMVNFVGSKKVVIDGATTVHKFVGSDALNQFCLWLFHLENVNSIALAHNCKGYDGQFILDWLYANAMAPEVIYNGLKVMQMTYMKVRVLDSLNFLPMRLSDLPKAFGFEGEKGHFPHLYNRQENWSTVRQGLPDQSFYQPEQMMPKDRAEFDKWYAEHQDELFNFDEQLDRYCMSDVDILAKACMRFRSIVLQEHAVDPFVVAATVAGMCMHIWQFKFAGFNDIGIVPHLGYGKQKDRQSKVAIKYLKWLAHSRQLNIQHALNGGEVTINVTNKTYKVDGQDRADPHQIWEFHGCVWHGCPRCFKDRQQKVPDSQQTAHDAYVGTLIKARDLKNAGYTVHSMWECELQNMLADDLDMSDFFDEVKVHEPMNPRDGFLGGRTNPRKLYHNCVGDEKIRYVDVCSLYPYVCKYGTFPAGHPTVYTENFEEISVTSQPYHGMISCRVLAPKQLLHPVLPCRLRGKLLFYLCHSCALEQSSQCNHDSEERAFSGVWPTCELYKALDHGYRILEVHEVYHYKEMKTLSATNSGMFDQYINAFLKSKQEASGWPSDVHTDEDKARYIAAYEEREGVKLDVARIALNPGLRQLSKLCLNSFWGKFGQRANMPRTELIKKPERLFELLTRNGVVVHKLDMVNDIVLRIQFTEEDEFVQVSPRTSCIIAAWVTAQARLKLYSFLEPLADRVLYMDTDSVVYLDRPEDAYKVPLGNFLGEMTDELPGTHIREWVSSGPKQYGYRTASGKTTIKVRGITLDSTIAQTINFEAMKKLVITLFDEPNEEDDVVVVHRRQIGRFPDHTVVTKPTQKTFRYVYDKCHVRNDFVCVPYGYCG